MSTSMPSSTSISTTVHTTYTVTEFHALTDPQRQAIKAVAVYLTGQGFHAEPVTEFQLNNTLDILKPHDESMAADEDQDPTATIRKRLEAVYEAGIKVAEVELQGKNTCGHSFSLVIDLSNEDTTQIAILDNDRPVCYLHESTQAQDFGFNSLSDLADAVLQVTKCLVNKVAALSTKEIYVIMEGGLVHEIINLPPNINVTVLDYDIEGIEKDSLEISPVDGELCIINKW